jgi:hypothetical protein
MPLALDTGIFFRIAGEVFLLVRGGGHWMLQLFEMQKAGTAKE